MVSQESKQQRIIAAFTQYVPRSIQLVSSFSMLLTQTLLRSACVDVTVQSNQVNKH